MKTHEITTSKGEFVVVCLPKGAHGIKVFNDIDRPYISYFIGIDTYREYVDEDVEFICKLSQATEEDAKLIVTTHESESINTHLMKLHFILHLMKLHFILKSKGIDINNGNWYLFKKLK